MPKLLMLANHFVDHGGGLEVIAHELACHLSQRPGFTVTMAAHGEAPDIGQYESIPLEASQKLETLTGLPLLLPQVSGLRKLAAAVKQSDCLIIHDNLYISHLHAQRIARKAGVPVVLVKHTGWVQAQTGLANFVQWLANRLLLESSLKSAERVVAVTQAKRDNILERVPGLPVEVIENGVDTSFFSGDRDAEDVDVLFIGRFVAKKGIGLVTKLCEACPDLRFLCVGFGPLAPKPEHHHNLEVISNPDRAEIRRAYQRARLTIVPCLSEGTPLTVMESLACETPVLASDQAAHPALTFMRTLPIDLGWPVPVVAEWAQAIRETIASQPDAKEMRTVICKQFSVAAMGDQYHRVIDELLKPD